MNTTKNIFLGLFPLPRMGTLWTNTTWEHAFPDKEKNFGLYMKWSFFWRDFGDGEDMFLLHMHGVTHVLSNKNIFPFFLCFFLHSRKIHILFRKFPSQMDNFYPRLSGCLPRDYWQNISGVIPNIWRQSSASGYFSVSPANICGEDWVRLWTFSLITTHSGL